MDALLTSKQVAQMLNCSPMFVKHHSEFADKAALKQPAIKAIRLGRQRLVRYRMADVEQFISEQAKKTVTV